MNSPAQDLSQALARLHRPEELVQWLSALFEQHSLFYGHGTDNPWDEAVVLVFAAMGLALDADESALERVATDAEKRTLERMIYRRVDERCPAPYITGEAWFAGLSFYVDERVLIPRSPIAEWIERRFEPWVRPDEVTRILEIGTGSGCIAIALALAFPEASVVASDLSADALEVAARNVERYQLGQRVQLVESDLYSRVSGDFDLIVTNPPYVDAHAMRSMPPEYMHEPASALAAGEDGLDLVHLILEQGRSYLRPHGVMVVEVGASQEAFERAYPHLPVIWLDLERGGEGVFLVDAAELRDAMR